MTIVFWSIISTF